MDCIFCKVANGTVKCDIVYENEHVMAFRDISPQAPQHVLIIPRKHIASVNEFSEQDLELFGHLGLAAKQVAKQLGVDQSGYRLVLNTNEHGGQTVHHTHMHMLAGRQMSWPPG